MTLLDTAIAVFIGLTIRDILNTAANTLYWKYKSRHDSAELKDLLNRLNRVENEKPE